MATETKTIKTKPAKIKPAKTTKPDASMKILRAVADGSRTASDLKKVLRRDCASEVAALVKDGSLEKVENELQLTKRGAGRLRMAS